VKVTVLFGPIPTPPSPIPPAMLAAIERVAAEQWPGVPVAPVMEAGATDGMFTRLAGIPTYAPSALVEDPDDVRAHGRDERVPVEAFEQATEFWYRLVKAFAGDGA
jgi:acetylornithine deacetylase/succinyl-diaminopimelate desuccinylase-like protein